MSNIEIVPGALIQITQYEHKRLPVVGVVIKSDVWSKYANKSNSILPNDFKPEYYGFRVFGLVINESYQEPRIIYYSWEDPRGHIMALASPEPQER